MKLPALFRRKRAVASSEAMPEDTSPEVHIDITLPRECFYIPFEGNPGPCPRCGGPLYQSYQVYYVATRRGRQLADSFILGGDFGWFCTQCPTVVINPADVSAHLQHGLPHWDIGDKFLVAGIVDLDAVPEDKEDIPLGEEDNPIPLVEFTRCHSLGDKKIPSHPSSAAGKRKQKGKRRKKHRR